MNIVDGLGPKSFIVEGNIGAGKSTFLKIIQNNLDVQVVFEPHEKWQEVVDGHNLLDKFYKDTARWAYTFQSYAFVTRVMELEAHAKVNTTGIQVLERSVFSDRYCFAKNAFEQGFMSALEWKLYQEWFSWLVDNYVPKPTGFIYLRGEPDVCHGRLKKRNRSEEEGVPFEYLNRLHEKHDTWLLQKEGVAGYLKDVPVLILECNNDFENSEAEQQRHIEKVAAFLAEHAIRPLYKSRQTSMSL